MQFDAPKVLEALNAEWRWVLPEIDSVLAVSSMGNVLLRSVNRCYWRVCPEELSAVKFAADDDELAAAFSDPEQKADWRMAALVEELVDAYGELAVGECFGLVVPAVLGGEYSVGNIRRRGLYEYLRFTGDIGNQTKDMRDGEKLELRFE